MTSKQVKQGGIEGDVTSQDTQHTLLKLSRIVSVTGHKYAGCLCRRRLHLYIIDGVSVCLFVCLSVRHKIISLGPKGLRGASRRLAP